MLRDAAAVDARAAAGEDVRPLCGLAFAVKDNIDVVGYPTEAGTPALEGAINCQHQHHDILVGDPGQMSLLCVCTGSQRTCCLPDW